MLCLILVLETNGTLQTICSRMLPEQCLAAENPGKAHEHRTWHDWAVQVVAV